jgi:hypothetical protein
MVLAETLYLHIGLPKSGTTFLQAALQENRERLAERDGLLWPGPRWVEHIRAASDLLDKRPAGVPDPAGAWDRMLDDVRAFAGRGGVVSMEWLCQAEPRHLARLRETLGGLDLQVIVTVRDLARTLPSAWQEFCQNWETPTLREFLESVASESPMDTHISRIFWTEQDLGKILPRWVDAFSPSQVTVVTVPGQGGSAALWNRFAEALGIGDAAAYDTNLRGSNSSLGLASAELMRRVNLVSHRDNLPPDVYQRAFKMTLAKEVLVERRPREGVVGLPHDFADFVAERAALQVDQIKAAGVRLIGDLDDLGAGGRLVDELPEDQPAEALLEAALDGIVSFGRALDASDTRHRHALEEARERVRRLEEELAVLRNEYANKDERWRDAPLRAAAISLSEQKPLMRRARVAYWNAVNAGRRIRGLPTP